MKNTSRLRIQGGGGYKQIKDSNMIQADEGCKQIREQVKDKSR
jgi:hypothetical protein